MNQISASRESGNPLGWNLRYWLNIYVIGLIEGKDDHLMAARIDWEHIKLAQTPFKNSLRSYWDKFRADNKDLHFKEWSRKAKDDDYNLYLNDLNRLLENTEKKTNDYIKYQKSELSRYEKNGNWAKVEQLSKIIRKLSGRLDLEATPPKREMPQQATDSMAHKAKSHRAGLPR